MNSGLIGIGFLNLSMKSPLFGSAGTSVCTCRNWLGAADFLVVMVMVVIMVVMIV
jgi:hypothetical protein